MYDLLKARLGYQELGGQSTQSLVQHNEQLHCNVKNARHILFIKNLNHTLRRLDVPLCFSVDKTQDT